MITFGLVPAQAADTTLACQGTLISEWGSTGSARKSSEVINIGIIVDLQKGTVTGLEPTAPLTIDDLTETMISFSGSSYWDKKVAWKMSGTLDRITGSLVAVSNRYQDPKNMLSFDLQCRPTQRMF